MKNIIVFGASGHGAVVLDCIEKEGKYNVMGFLDSYKKKGTRFCGYEILGTEYDLPYLKDKFNIAGGIIAIGDNWTRKIVVKRVSGLFPDFKFIKAIHPQAVIGKNVRIGMGTVVMPGGIINANSTVGKFCILNTNCSLGHDGAMSNFSSLAPGVCVGGNLRLGIYSSVGLGANIIEGITIGRHTIVGAGSLVVSNLPDQVVSYGSPAKIIRSRQVGEPYLSVRNNRLPYPGLLDRS